MREGEIELLTGMRNCYASCGDNFDNTVRMVANARGLDPEYVKVTLRKMSKQYSGDADYRRLRKEIPDDFPF